MVGSKTVFFMDEISTGLDSSTTYAIVKFLRDQTHALNYTTMISLLQPAPESYDLFDDILLLAEGMTFIIDPYGTCSAAGLLHLLLSESQAGLLYGGIAASNASDAENKVYAAQQLVHMA